MNISEFAKAAGVKKKTVSTWASNEVIPGAELVETLAGKAWAIPESALKTIDTWRPTRGRRKGANKENGYKPEEP